MAPLNWSRNFKQYEFSIADEDQMGRPVFVSTPVDVHAVHGVILWDREIELKQISEALNISYEQVHQKVHVDLDTRRISAK